MQIQNNMDYIAKIIRSVITGCWGSQWTPSQRNWSYGHGGCGNRANCDSLSILPTLLCKGLTIGGVKVQYLRVKYGLPKSAS